MIQGILGSILLLALIMESLPALGAETSIPPSGYYQGGNTYASAALACAAYVKAEPGAKPAGQPTYEGQGSIRCYKIRSDGSEDSLSTVAVQCPDGAQPSGMTSCNCDAGLIVTGKKCAPPAIPEAPTPPHAVPAAPSPEASQAGPVCNFEFRRSTTPQGGDPLSNLLCEKASNGAPSYLVYPRRQDGRLGSQITEVDAMRGRTWFECKCGYLSTAEGASKGDKRALQRLAGDNGIDKKILTQASVAAECGYEYRLVVANPKVEKFFRERYSFLQKIDVVPFEACE